VIQRVPVKIVFDDARIGNYVLAPGMSVLPSITIQAKHQ
jgi:membrane fusion protein (multidrug efflux system)